MTMGGFPLRVTWVVLSSTWTREREAVDSATAFLKDIEQAAVGEGFPGRGSSPGRAQRSKKCSSSSSWKCRRTLSSPVRRDDAHQDHRLVADLT
jgi:hypothetical protein